MWASRSRSPHADRQHGDLTPWLLLVAAIVMIDAVQMRCGAPTLTAAFHRAVRHPLRRWPVIAAWATVTSHLLLGKP
jgi:hypothetical protein